MSVWVPRPSAPSLSLPSVHPFPHFEERWTPPSGAAFPLHCSSSTLEGPSEVRGDQPQGLREVGLRGLRPPLQEMLEPLQRTKTRGREGQIQRMVGQARVRLRDNF